MKANIIFVKISFVLCTSTPFSGNTCMFEFFFVEILEISLLVDKKIQERNAANVSIPAHGELIVVFRCAKLNHFQLQLH